MTKEKALLYLKDYIIQDEYEYCFDKSYCSDENWKLMNNISRQQAFEKSKQFINNLSLDEIKDFYGDKYDSIYNYLFNGDEIK